MASNAGFLRDMIGFASQRVMELETEAICNAAPGNFSGFGEVEDASGHSCDSRTGRGVSEHTAPSKGLDGALGRGVTLGGGGDVGAQRADKGRGGFCGAGQRNV